MFNYISASFNPSGNLFGVVVGSLNAKEFFALSFSELLGAFLGAVLVWLTFLPHFNLVPEPPEEEETDPYNGDSLLRQGGGRRPFTTTELNIVSYNNNPEDQYMRHHPGAALHAAATDIGSLLGLARRDLNIKREELQASLRRRSLENRADVEAQLRTVEEQSRTLQEHEMRARAAEEQFAEAARSPQPSAALDTASGGRDPGSVSKVSTVDEDGARGVQPVKTAAQLRYEAELVADRNIKLGIFCTRPAIYSPLNNFFCEFLCSCTLQLMANMIAQRGNQLLQGEREFFSVWFGFALGFLVFLLVLSIGGPTGLAVNPARDLGPRIAHWVLPIPGKGSSEFVAYGWIPVIAPFCGGAAAGGIYRLLQKLNHSNLPAGSVLCS